MLWQWLQQLARIRASTCKTDRATKGAYCNDDCNNLPESELQHVKLIGPFAAVTVLHQFVGTRDATCKMIGSLKGFDDDEVADDNDGADESNDAYEYDDGDNGDDDDDDDGRV